ncbi:MAG: NAD(P)H-hydrate dehydratase [Bacteroidales bacterium]|nr:NAD(P)H-hydrate dehydratase [Bacteroidales bacterium]
MKILNAKQLHEADAYTIAQQKITSVDLMERAAKAFVESFIPKNENIYIFCGNGNNGGDALAIARLISEGYDLEYFEIEHIFVYIIKTSDHASADFRVNYEKLILSENEKISITHLDEFQNITIPTNATIVDGIFGSGLNRPISGFVAQYIEYLNSLPNERIAIDIPSGLYADKPISKNDIVFQADETITFHSPKLQFLFAENDKYVGELTIKDIDLVLPFSKHEAPIQFVTDVHLNKRPRFAHKGTFGHALLVAGSYGKMGAATLGTKACLKMGCGLITTHIPSCGYEILQISIPEAMASVDDNDKIISKIPDTEKYSAIGIGPGIGTEETTATALLNFLQENKKPLVLDADALNILSTHEKMWQYIPENTILTPHPKEFDRLTHNHTNSYDRFITATEFAKEKKCIVVLKGHYTCIANPNGEIYFNSTGNSNMATAGSGDVLTGVILSLLAQQYSPKEAAINGVFLHGLAGDEASCDYNFTAPASNFIQHLNTDY